MSYSRSNFQVWRPVSPAPSCGIGKTALDRGPGGSNFQPPLRRWPCPGERAFPGYGSGLARGPEVGPLGEAVLRCHRDKVLGVTSGGYGRLGASSGLPRPGAALSGTAVRGVDPG
ncbi:hypothetical protein G5714_024564 [Onychostoma macrolepis]|uniref:Uncharacterized protein n=1 Tax=Onychostoma macrolepis TaxID=369639 RepID=A0A7J6BK26_9TELE|nr:hypothetical protein G5714_024564 [Onychostoma macrolepis]